MSQKSFDFEAKKMSEADKRDRVLDRLAEIRAELIEAGKHVAVRIYEDEGRVSGPEVRREMRKSSELAEKMSKVDARWVGVIFRRGWSRIGFEPEGSHSQPISVWELVDRDIVLR